MTNGSHRTRVIPKWLQNGIKCDEEIFTKGRDSEKWEKSLILLPSYQFYVLQIKIYDSNCWNWRKRRYFENNELFWHFRNFDAGISCVQKVTRAGYDKLGIDFHAPKKMLLEWPTIPLMSFPRIFGHCTFCHWLFMIKQCTCTLCLKKMANDFLWFISIQSFAKILWIC